jgi:hypothetical protein
MLTDPVTETSDGECSRQGHPSQLFHSGRKQLGAIVLFDLYRELHFELSHVTKDRRCPTRSTQTTGVSPTYKGEVLVLPLTVSMEMVGGSSINNPRDAQLAASVDDSTISQRERINNHEPDHCYY